jgi:hypothetical protein
MRPSPPPTRLRRSSKRVLFCAASVIVAASFAGAPAHAQGLFDFLFGGGGRFVPAPPPLHYPDYGYERGRSPARVARPPHEGEGERAHRRALARSAVDEKPGKYVAPEVMPGPLGRFLRDSTLRRGDVVATARGLMVFRGEAGARHSEHDFVALSGAKNFAAGNRADLVALEAALKRGHAPSHVSERIAAVDPPVVAQDEDRRK